MTGSLQHGQYRVSSGQVWSFLQVPLLSCIHLLLVVLLDFGFLFMGGYLVGALWALESCLVAFIVAKKNKYPVEKGQMAHAGKIIKEGDS